MIINNLRRFLQSMAEVAGSWSELAYLDALAAELRLCTRKGPR